MNENTQRLYAQLDRLKALEKAIAAAPNLPKTHPRAHEVYALFDKSDEITIRAEELSGEEQVTARLDATMYSLQAAELYLQLVKEKE